MMETKVQWYSPIPLRRRRSRKLEGHLHLCHQHFESQPEEWSVRTCQPFGYESLAGSLPFDLNHIWRCEDDGSWQKEAEGC
jgi:hypothetical protein